jgi:hypothetical protein
VGAQRRMIFYEEMILEQVVGTRFVIVVGNLEMSLEWGSAQENIN